MADKPKDPKGISVPRPERPALYRNKDPKNTEAKTSSVAGRTPPERQKLDLTPEQKPGYTVDFPNKIVQPKKTPLIYTEETGLTPLKSPKPLIEQLGYPDTPDVHLGGLMDLKASKAKEPSVSGKPVEVVKNSMDAGNSPDLPLGKSLKQVLSGLGDLAKTTPSMARTRPVIGKNRALSASGNILGPDYDTKLEKSHALKMRYRIPTKLQRIASHEPEKLQKLGHYIHQQILLEENERTQWIERLVQYRQSWQDFISAGLDPAFEGAHNVHIPHTFSSIKAMHSRIYQAVMGIKPAFSLKPLSSVPEIWKEDKEELLNWIIESYSNRGDGWEETIDFDIWNFVADGTSITKQYWLKDVRKYTDVTETLKRPIELDDDGYPRMDEEEIEKEELLFDCPILENVKIEDLYITGRKVTNTDDADLVAHAQQYSKSDLIKMARQGFFFQDQVDEVLKLEPQFNNPSPNRLNTAIKQLDDYVTGYNKLGTLAGTRLYNIYEAYLRYDIDEDGIDEELVVWVEERSRRVLRVTYLERVGPRGKRPFVLKKFIPQAGAFGKGLGEILYGLSNELDYVHNQRLDYGTLQNLPFFFYRAASGLNPVEIKLGPGMGVPVDDPQGDVNFPRLNGGTNYGFQEEAQVTRYAENASGITQFSLGNISQQGATRTATGTAALVNELNSNIDIHIKRYQRGYRKNLIILDLQIQDLLPLGTVVRVLGADGTDLYKRFENREALKFQSDFELTANSINSNKAIERENAQMLLQQLANPIALQTGIVTQENLYKAFKNLLQKFEFRDIDAFITKPQDSPESPFDGKQEINMIVVGVEPPLVMKDRHAEKVQLFNAFEQDDDFHWLTDSHMPLYLKVKKYHEDMAAAISAQAQNPLLQSGISNPALAGQLAAGGRPPTAPAQQQSDLGQKGGVLQTLQGQFTGNVGPQGSQA